VQASLARQNGGVGCRANILRIPNWGRAAETLDRLADETNNMSDEEWSELSIFYGWNSETWHDAVSKASRHVGFQTNVRTFSDYVNNLLGILSEQQHVNH
jgi:hypothetical protein